MSNDNNKAKRISAFSSATRSQSITVEIEPSDLAAIHPEWSETECGWFLELHAQQIAAAALKAGWREIIALAGMDNGGPHGQ